MYQNIIIRRLNPIHHFSLFIRLYRANINDKEYIINHLSEKKYLLAPDEQLALQRRIDQMSMDYLFDTLELTHSLHELENRIERLAQKGLYPLPQKNYTKKYATFCKLISSKTGRRILLGYCVLKVKMA